MEAKEMTPGTLLRRRFGWRLAPLVLCLAGAAACSYSIRSGPSLSVGGIFPRPATTADVVNNTSCDARVKLVGEEEVRVLAPGGTASFRFYGACDEFVIVASASCGRQNIGAVSAKFWAPSGRSETYAWILDISHFKSGSELRWPGTVARPATGGVPPAVAGGPTLPSEALWRTPRRT
jgi:hypothetical protein